MATTDVVLSDGLVRAARAAAAESGRSIEDQIEFWARLGQCLAGVLSPEQARKLRARASRSRRPRQK